MWAAIKLFFSSNVAKISEALGVAAIGAGVVTAIFQSGKKSGQVIDLKKVVKDGNDARKIEDNNRADLRDGDAAKQLRDHWS